ncbi:Predicted GTPase [Yersinia bercovieri ATCC 43970]|uniref:Predicted GTPase n=1 Tax=Yersinia bercovieri ATCC 43970 TaxID=349968 RepID=A0ABP2E0F8_YERBE|nr:Predicted GTPase [Yersinia bercovieri ATCC 43970]
MNALMYMFENGTGEVVREKGEWWCQGREALFGFIWHINLRELK